MKTWEATAREHLRAIITRTLEAVTPQVFMRETVKRDGNDLVIDGARVPLHRDDGVVRLAAIGKAAYGMAVQAEAWGPFEEAVVVSTEGSLPMRSPDTGDGVFELLPADHPVPTERSVRAGERVLELARATGENDTLLLLISGGASALADAPAVPLEDLRDTTDVMLKSGMDIHATNAVRKHLSLLKGGRLAEAAAPGRVVALALSDVARDDPDTIGSGPVSPDPTTYRDAVDGLRAHGAWDALPTRVRERLASGLEGKTPETPKPGDPTFSRVHYHVLAGNKRALTAAQGAANALGYHALALEEALRGEARDVGQAIVALAHDAAKGDLVVKPPCAIILGGETVVRVHGHGKGGRSQEAALAAVEGLSGRRAALATLATDGVDGPTDAAGAIVDGLTLARARKLGLDPRVFLEENDSYHFFEPLQDLVQTGPTGTNVRDVAILLVGRTDAEETF